jgi:Na+-translocating ferredoxin:NAD+ oxidoreductase RnfG subunit
MRIKLYVTFVALSLMIVGLASLVSAKVFMQKEEALQQAFPQADIIEKANLYLTPPEREQILKASGVKPGSALYTFYIGKRNGVVIGYAAIEAATVRTLPETVIVVLEPDGSVSHVEILAFFEPEEYKPSKRWLKQFPGRTLSTQLRIGGDIHGITGATLSAQAITRQVRKTAAMLKIYLEGDNR